MDNIVPFPGKAASTPVKEYAPRTEDTLLRVRQALWRAQDGGLNLVQITTEDMQILLDAATGKLAYEKD